MRTYYDQDNKPSDAANEKPTEWCYEIVPTPKLHALGFEEQPLQVVRFLANAVVLLLAHWDGIIAVVNFGKTRILSFVGNHYNPRYCLGQR